MCILNNGGLRTALPKGEITRGKIFELMPFENELTVITLTGSNAMRMFEYLAGSGGAPVAGIKMGIDNGKPVHVYLGTESFDSLKTYRVVTSDYLANGGDKYSFFKQPLAREDLGIKVRDAIIHFIEKEKKTGKNVKCCI
jgi:2',3'-cyclic-nucleotide 2'-phosphodiesterase (5'-nucleotidase family)